MDEKLNLLNQACIAGDHLFEFIQLLPHSAHIKDIQTGRYLTSNKINAQIYGVAHERDIIGLVVDDIEGPDYVKAVHHLDAKLKAENQQISDSKRVIVNRNGILRLQTMVKTPIRGYQHKRAQSILTLCYDEINQLSLIDLFSLYLTTYSQKTLAVQCFLKHIKINDCFKYHHFLSLFPTPKEMEVLLNVATLGDYKHVARSLNLSLKTIEYHIANLKDKIHPGTFESLLAKLRDRNGTQT